MAHLLDYLLLRFIGTPLLKVPPASRGEPCGGLVPALGEGNQKGSVPPAGRGNLQEGVRKILLRTPRVCVYALARLQTALRVCVYALARLQTALRV